MQLFAPSLMPISAKPYWGAISTNIKQSSNTQCTFFLFVSIWRKVCFCFFFNLVSVLARIFMRRWGMDNHGVRNVRVSGISLRHGYPWHGYLYRFFDFGHPFSFHGEGFKLLLGYLCLFLRGVVETCYCYPFLGLEAHLQLIFWWGRGTITVRRGVKFKLIDQSAISNDCGGAILR